MFWGLDFDVYLFLFDDMLFGIYEVFEGYEEVECYWVNVFFVYVVVIYDMDVIVY